MNKWKYKASTTSLRTRIRLSIRKSANRLSSQKMTCCHWPSGRVVCFWAQWRRTSLALTVNLGTFTIRLAVGTRHQPPIHRLAGNYKIHVWLPCTPQASVTESSVFNGKAIQHAVIPVISFTWSSSTPSTDKISTFAESFDDAIEVLLWIPTSLAIFRYEHPFRQYPTTIPAICSITGRTIITSICRPSLVIVVLVSREQLWLWRSRCTIRNIVQIGWNCTYGTEHSWFPSVIYTKTHTTLANIPLDNLQTKDKT